MLMLHCWLTAEENVIALVATTNKIDYLTIANTQNNEKIRHNILLEMLYWYSYGINLSKHRTKARRC